MLTFGENILPGSDYVTQQNKLRAGEDEGKQEKDLITM